ncbi:hypothetical protein H7F51_11075 [Novosphingobium flavum]|uniref:Uncharacterized protein n=1 Tax=Novosphingobium flavum TaxID=1778672 RepID=A0A7X1KLY1_9SPHN|nr:hypothetical protein [Novosphingobium flavum]MBC2666059.1 hypothetical protein [Novosphingobium flavum]
MIHIRTWTEAEHALDHLPAQSIRPPLQAHLDRLREYDDYDLHELAVFLIIEDGNRLDAAEHVLDRQLVDRDTGLFSTDPEYVVRHDAWAEVLWILSDDGYGLLLFAPLTSRSAPELVTACHAVLRSAEGPADL